MIRLRQLEYEHWFFSHIQSLRRAIRRRNTVEIQTAPLPGRLPARPSSLHSAKLILAHMNPWLVSIPLAYLLGSIPFGYVLVRLFRHEDIRTTGSGNIGATNVLRSGSKGLGIATLLLDALKGFVAVFIAQHLAVRAGFPAAFDIAAAAAFVWAIDHTQAH